MKKTDKCRVCGIKPISDENGYDRFESSVALVVDDWTGLYACADANGSIGLYAHGDSETDIYYLKFCPECGKKLSGKGDI